MAYIAMALDSYGLCSYGLHSYGLDSYGLCSYGLYSYIVMANCSTTFLSCVGAAGDLASIHGG